MIELEHILPSTYNLQINMTLEEALKRQNLQKSTKTLYKLADIPIELYITFTEDKRLSSLYIYMHRSLSQEEYDNNKLEGLVDKYLEYYNDQVKVFLSVLGAWTFSGTHGDNLYPNTETSWYVTLWDRGIYRIQIEFDQPDTIFPLFIKASCIASI